MSLLMKLVCILNVVQAIALAQSPTPLERLAGQTQVAASRASASAADARSAVHEVHARLAAEASARSRQAAEAVASKIAHTAVTIKGAVVEAQTAQAGVAAAREEAKAVMDEGRLAMVKAEAAAAAHVTELVEGKLANAYKSHAEWKMKVIHDPVKEAAKAGMKAALPYEHALQTLEKRVGDYESRASGLSNQARSLRVAAVGVANNAVEQQAAGALKVAQQNMINAHVMMNQATHFEAQGHALMNQAQTWNQQIPTYVGAAAGAAHQMTQQVAKNLLSPPPLAVSHES